MIRKLPLRHIAHGNVVLLEGMLEAKGEKQVMRLLLVALRNRRRRLRFMGCAKSKLKRLTSAIKKIKALSE